MEKEYVVPLNTLSTIKSWLKIGKKLSFNTCISVSHKIFQDL